MSHAFARRLAGVLVITVAPALAHAGTRLAAETPARGGAPNVLFSTLLGGANGEFDGISDLAVDATGNAVVVGTTESSDFPIKNALQDSLEGQSDAFIAKFDPNGALIFSTFLGGDEGDSATAVAVDQTGAIYVTGSTGSNDFPLMNAAQSTPGGSADVFVTKLSADGSTIVYSTRLGGNGIDSARDIAVDAVGRAYVIGEVTPVSGTATFPTVNPVQNGYGGGTADAFASFFSADGSAVIFSTLLDTGVLGGISAGRDRVTSLAIDPESGDVFVGGNVETSEDEPENPFIGRFRPAETDSGREKAQAPPQAVYYWIESLMAELDEDQLDAPSTFGVKFSVIWLVRFSIGSFDPPPTRGTGGTITTLVEGFCHPASAGAGCDEPAALAVFDPALGFQQGTNLPLLREFFHEANTADGQGAIYIAGDLSSDRLTTVNPFQPVFGGGDDAVVAVLAPGTFQKAMVSFLGGDGFDSPTSIAVDLQGNIWVAGLSTLSTTFPTTPGALQTTPKGRNDGFLVKISAVGPFAEAPDFSLSFANPTVDVSRGQKVTVPLTVTRVGGFDGKVKVSPPPQMPGFKSPKKSPSVPGTTLALKFKVKSDAPAGPTSFTFTGTDKDGRTRTATVTLNVE